MRSSSLAVSWGSTTTMHQDSKSFPGGGSSGWVERSSVISGMLWCRCDLGEADLLQRPIDHSLQLACVFDFAALGQDFLAFLGAKPGRISRDLLRSLYPLYLKQKRFVVKLPH